MKRYIYIAALSIGLVWPLATAGAGDTPILVEMFTSEGCSSCPPADRFAGELRQRDDVVVLSFHVNYWDYIGWADRFATDETTNRQHAYARALGQTHVYTPQAVIHGTTHKVGSDHGAVNAAIRAAALGQSPQPSIAFEQIHRSTVRISIGDAPTDEPAEVFLVGFASEGESEVRRGENAGRTLKTYNVVHDIRRLGTWSGAATVFDLAATEIMADGSDNCAVIVQARGNGPVFAVAAFEMAK